MNGYNFSERVRNVLALARKSAIERQHEYVGTEHMLLGILQDNGGVAAAVLQHFSIDRQEVRQRIDGVIGTGKAGRGVGPDLPYTSRAKKVLELAMAEARDLNHAYVGTEHLLLGLLREERGIGAQVLVEFGATTAAAREETLRLLGSTTESRAQTDARMEPMDPMVPRRETNATTRVIPPSTIASITIEVRYKDGSVTREEFPGVMPAISHLCKADQATEH